MKKLIYLFTVFFAFVSCSDDNGNDGQGLLFESNLPTFVFSDSEGNDLFNKGVYKTNKLSVIATDENWNDLDNYYFNPNNEKPKMQDIEGFINVHHVGKDDKGRTMVTLMLLHEHLVVNDSVTSYYKLQYDDNKYDYIKTQATKGKNFYHIHKVSYNGKEFLIDLKSPTVGLAIEIVK